MKRKTKTQLFAFFILLVFIGSSVAIAVMSAFAPAQEQKVKLIYDQPLTNADEAQFLQKNFVVLKYFFSDECETCDTAMVENLINDLAGKIIIEKIDTQLYPEEAQTFSVQEVPYYYFKGNSVVKLLGEKTGLELFETACSLYFEEIDQCEFYLSFFI